MIVAKIGELERRMANVVRVGKVLSADYSSATVTVALGKNKTTSLPWLAQRAGNDRVWHPPEVGEQVVVISPSGNLAQGFVLSGAIFKQDFPANGSSADKSLTTYKDGAVVQYDRAAHAYSITIPSGGKATIAAGSNAQAIIEDSDVKLSYGSNASIVITSTGITLTFGSTYIKLSSSGITTNGDISQTGKITASGNITSAGDVKAGTVSLDLHLHSAVQTGSGISGPPVP